MDNRRDDPACRHTPPTRNSIVTEMEWICGVAPIAAAGRQSFATVGFHRLLHAVICAASVSRCCAARRWPDACSMWCGHSVCARQFRHIQTGFSHKRIRNRIGPHGPHGIRTSLLQSRHIAGGRALLSDGPGVSTVICVFARSCRRVRA